MVGTVAVIALIHLSWSKLTSNIFLSLGNLEDVFPRATTSMEWCWARLDFLRLNLVQCSTLLLSSFLYAHAYAHAFFVFITMVRPSSTGTQKDGLYVKEAGG